MNMRTVASTKCQVLPVTVVAMIWMSTVSQALFLSLHLTVHSKPTIVQRMSLKMAVTSSPRHVVPMSKQRRMAKLNRWSKPFLADVRTRVFMQSLSYIDSEDGDDSKHPLVVIGILLGQNLEETIGRQLVEAGDAWSNQDWQGVTMALAEASASLLQFLETKEGSINFPMSSLDTWQSVAHELHDVSMIEGCSSVGPPASVPNWVAIQEFLRNASDASMSTIGDVDGQSQNDGALIDRLIAMEIDRLIDSI